MWLPHCRVATSGCIPVLKVITHIRHPLHRDLAFSGYRSPRLSSCPFRPRRDGDTHQCWPGVPYPLFQFCYIFLHACVNWLFIKPSLYVPNLRVLSPPGALMGVGTSVRYVIILPCRWGNGETEMLGYASKVTQRISEPRGLKNQAVCPWAMHYCTSSSSGVGEGKGFQLGFHCRELPACCPESQSFSLAPLV